MTRSPAARRADLAADRAFAQFCRDGDADALAEVFDRTAPRLAVLAGHLVPGDAHAVEDLVQTTFLEAMRSADRFEAGRPVMPWLVTILARRAANLRRDGRRRGEDRGPERADPAPDPSALVADRELAERVADTIPQLDEPYREALALRLVHGLTPAEIARALGRPLGTVHAQLHRGAERLRRMLPPGVAVALAGLLAVRDGLAAVRVRVLDAAHVADAAAASAVPAGLTLGAIMSKKVVAGLAVLVAGALIAWGVGGAILGSEERPLRDAAAPARTARLPSAESGVHAPGPVDRDTRRRELAAAAEVDPVTFVGRVVAAESGLPIPGAEVRGWLSARLLAYTLPDELVTPRVCATDRQGRYRLELPPNGDAEVTLVVTSPGRATMVGDWSDSLRAGAVADSGEVPMVLGAELSLRVHDDRGEPVEGFEIQLDGRFARPRSADGVFSAIGWGGIQRTDARGIAGPRSVPAGAWAVEYAEGTGHRYAGPRTIRVPADRVEWIVDLAVAAPERPEWTVSGVVVDEGGAPVVGVEVFAQQSDDRGWRVESTFGGGHFLLSGFPPEKGPVVFDRVGRGPGFEIVEPRHAIDPGTHDVRVVVRRVATTDVPFRVVAARDGAPIEHFAFTAVPVRHVDGATRLGDRGSGSLIVEPARRHPAGNARLEGLYPVDHLLVVVPESADYEPVRFVEFRPGSDTSGPIEVPLRGVVTWRVRVVDGDGAPVDGSSVAFLRGVGRTRVTERTYTQTMRRAFARGISATYLAIATSEGTTGSDGTVLLRTAPDVEGCALRIRGPLHVGEFVPLTGEVAQDETREVTVEPAARIVGRLTPVELVSALGPSAGQRAAASVFEDPEYSLAKDRIELALRDGDSRERDTARVADDGGFVFDAVPPGDYHLTARFSDVRGSVELAAVSALRAGESREVVLDLGPHRPATIRAAVRLDGAPPPGGASLRLSGALTADLDEAGRFEARVVPGRYECTLSVPVTVGSGNVHRFERAQPLVVRAGEDVDAALDFVRRRAELHVVGPAGAPVAGKWIRFHEIGPDGEPAGYVGTLVLDADGRATFERSFDRPLVAVLWLDPPTVWSEDEEPGRHAVLGRVAVPPGESSASFEFSVDRSALGR